MFISLEGTDGAGKGVQKELLVEYIEKTLKKEVVSIYDPGSTKISEKLRGIVLDVENKEMSPVCEALIYSAARAQMVHEKIKPALLENKVVITDRYVDSSLVYQGETRGLGYDTIKMVNDFATSMVYPDLTFFLNIDTAVAMERRKSVSKLDRIEQEGLDFQEKVRLAYVENAKKEPNRIKVIDASKSIEEVHEQIVNQLNEYLNRMEE